MIKTAKDRCLETAQKMGVEITEKVVYRLTPVGRKGYAKMTAFLQLFKDGKFFIEDGKTKTAYRRANAALKWEAKYARPDTNR